MAVLPDADRIKIWRGFMRHLSQNREAVSLLKADLRAAVDATDDWIDNNQASFNSALPLAARNNLTAGQKTLLFCAVAAMRAGEVWVRRILGEVN